MLRVDVRDNLMKLLFERYEVNLLSVPRNDVTLGEIILVAGERAFGPVEASELISGITIPDVKSEHVADIEEAWTDTRSIEGQLSFMQKLLAAFLPADWLPDVSAKAKANGASKAQARFSKVTRDWIDIAALARAVAGCPIDLAAFAVGRAVTVYVVTDVFRAREIVISWTDDRGHELDAKLGLPHVASIKGQRLVRTTTKGAQKAATTNPCFGVRLVALAIEDGFARLALERQMVDVLGEGDGTDFGFASDLATLHLDPFPEAESSDPTVTQ